MSRNRLQSGLIDKTKEIHFSFNGRNLTGFKGDTLASALFANGIFLVGRSFKYHRPRGIISAGSEEPNGLVTIKRSGSTVPNVQATTIELYQGLEAFSQNCWPSVENDFLAVNDLIAPFLPAALFKRQSILPNFSKELFKIYSTLSIFLTSEESAKISPSPNVESSCAVSSKTS